MKMKANKKGNELKVSDSNTYRLKNEERMKNGQRKVKNGGKSSRICIRKPLGSVTEAPLYLRNDYNLSGFSDILPYAQDYLLVA